MTLAALITGKMKMRTTIKKALEKIAALVVVAQERQVNLSAVATADLVAELELRDGVESAVIHPYDNATVSINGPAILFVVAD